MVKMIKGFMFSTQAHGILYIYIELLSDIIHYMFETTWVHCYMYFMLKPIFIFLQVFRKENMLKVMVQLGSNIK